MKYCQTCQRGYPDTQSNCDLCGGVLQYIPNPQARPVKYCPKCGNVSDAQADFCTSCGAKYGEDDKADALIIVAAILIPLVGIILAIMNWEKTPKAARKYLLAALISAGVSFVLVAMCYLLPLFLVIATDLF